MKDIISGNRIREIERLGTHLNLNAACFQRTNVRLKFEGIEPQNEAMGS